MMEPVTPDRERLSAFVKEAAKARAWTQGDFIERSDLSKSTVIRLWTAKPVSDATLRAVERTLGWARYSCDAVLEGGEPKPVEEALPAPADAARPDNVRTGLPAAVEDELADGVLYDIERVRTTVGGRPMTVVVLAIVDEPATDADRELRRARAEAWLRARQGAQGLEGGATGPDEDSDTSSD